MSFATLFLLTPCALFAQTSEQAALQLRESRVALSLALDYEEGSLRGLATFNILNVSDSPATEVPFNLNRLMTVQNVRDGQGAPVAFTQDVVTFSDSPRQQVTHVRVSLSVPLEPDSLTRLTLDYSGYLTGYTETGSRYIQDRIDEEFTILRADAYAFPVVGQTSWRANRAAPHIPFDFEVSVTLPERFTVASGGSLVERQVDDGLATYVYRSTAAAPFLNIPIAEYGLLKSDGIRVYYFPEDSAGAALLLDRAQRALALLTDWFGPLGQRPELAVMEIPDGWGSQASLAGGIIQTASAFRDLSQMRQLYHELTHLWNAPDTDLPSARWNEGLATYLERRIAAALDGWTGLDAYAERVAAYLVERLGETSDAAGVSFRRYGDAGLTDYSYSVGFLMFYLLGELLGDAAFDQAIGGYYQSHRETGGTFEDLIAQIDESSDSDLTRFFEEWVYTTTWLDQLRSGASVADLLERARL